MAKCPESSYSLDRWHSGVSALRTFLKGWGRNIRGDYRRTKNCIIQQIQELDTNMENFGFNHDMSVKRIQLEKELENIMGAEEIYWQQRGGEVEFGRGY